MDMSILLVYPFAICLWLRNFAPQQHNGANSQSAKEKHSTIQARAYLPLIDTLPVDAWVSRGGRATLRQPRPNDFPTDIGEPEVASLETMG